MTRLSKDTVVVSQPVRTFPNGDYFYIELCRKNSRYECVVQMTCSGQTKGVVELARGEGKTIREAEANCCEAAMDRCPWFPKPPYFKRGERSRKVATASAGTPGFTEITRAISKRTR